MNRYRAVSQLTRSLGDGSAAGGAPSASTMASPLAFSSSSPAFPLHSLYPKTSRGFASSTASSEFAPEDNSSADPFTTPRPLSDAELPDLTASVVNSVESDLITQALEGAWYNTEAVVRLIAYYHNELALPWWAAIFATTLTVRIGLSFPIAALSAKRMQRTVDASVELKPIHEEMKQYNIFTNPNAPKNVDRLIELRQEMKAIYKKHGADPTGPLKVILTQGLISGSIFLGLRRLVGAGLPSMTQEGVLWFNDLTVQDPYFALPVIVGGCFYAMVRRNINPDAGDMSGLQESNPMMNAETIKSTQRFMALAFVPFMAFMPAALNLYYMGSMGIGVVQAGLMRSAGFRKALGLPPKPGMSSAATAAAAAAAAAAGKS